MARGKVGAAEKGFAFRGEHHVQRPARASRGRLDIGDVQAVNIGSFFAVHFNRNEILLQDSGDAGIRIRFPLHDVAPMTREVADGQKDRLVLFAGFFKGCHAPWIPIHRIVGVQEKVGTLGVNEPVGVAVWPCSRARLRCLTKVGSGGDAGGSIRLFGSIHRTRHGQQECPSTKQPEMLMPLAQSLSSLWNHYALQV